MQPRYFDQENRLAKLEKLGDPLSRPDTIVDWQAFRPQLRVIYQKQRKNDASRKPQAASRMTAREEKLREKGYKSRIHRKGGQRPGLINREKETDHRRSKVRETVKIDLMIFIYNMWRLEFLLRLCGRKTAKDGREG